MNNGDKVLIMSFEKAIDLHCSPVESTRKFYGHIVTIKSKQGTTFRIMENDINRVNFLEEEIDKFIEKE